MLLHVFSTLASLTAVIAQSQAPAAIITDNASGAGYVASISSTTSPIIGSVQVLAVREGVQVDLVLNDFDLADSLDYTYHIHEVLVPADGNCTSTKAHFDNRGIKDEYVCDPIQPALCQLGDLSGKHGAIKLTNGHTAVNLHYVDPYLSTTPGNSAYIGDRSIVIHKKSDKKRLACANFRPLGQ